MSSETKKARQKKHKKDQKKSHSERIQATEREERHSTRTGRKGARYKYGGPDLKMKQEKRKGAIIKANKGRYICAKIPPMNPSGLVNESFSEILNC